MKAHVCVDCKVMDPPPKTIRKTQGGPRSQRCQEHRRAHAKRTKDARHNTYVQKVYGLSDGEYQKLLDFQGGTCAIPRCRASGRRKRLAVDHDHDTGTPRGLLCGPHNYQLLGVFAGDLQAGLDYLADPPYERMKREPGKLQGD